MKRATNPISNWNHRLPALACAALVTGLVLSGIAALAEPDLNAAAHSISAATTTSKVSA
ncbi:MAG: hypothetical protein JNM76_00600 [Betaproteobacteria bacterium]|nr:hypothetical protein [Betaproteobacteria bacterium]